MKGILGGLSPVGRRLCAVALAGGAALALSASPSSAAPTNAPSVFVIPATCDGQSVEFVLNSGRSEDNFAAAHVVGSTSVFVPSAVDIVFADPTTGEEVLPPELASKAGPRRGLTTCDIDTVITFPGGPVHVTGTVTGAFHGQ
jgi:hypothetical protein